MKGSATMKANAVNLTQMAEQLKRLVKNFKV